MSRAAQGNDEPQFADNLRAQIAERTHDVKKRDLWSIGSLIARSGQVHKTLWMFSVEDLDFNIQLQHDAREQVLTVRKDKEVVLRIRCGKHVKRDVLEQEIPCGMSYRMVVETYIPGDWLGLMDLRIARGLVREGLKRRAPPEPRSWTEADNELAKRFGIPTHAKVDS